MESNTVKLVVKNLKFTDKAELDRLLIKVYCTGQDTARDGIGLFESYCMEVLYRGKLMARYSNLGESSLGMITESIRYRAGRNLNDLKEEWKKGLGQGRPLNLNLENLVERLKEFREEEKNGFKKELYRGQ